MLLFLLLQTQHSYWCSIILLRHVPINLWHCLSFLNAKSYPHFLVYFLPSVMSSCRCCIISIPVVTKYAPKLLLLFSWSSISLEISWNLPLTYVFFFLRSVLCRRFAIFLSGLSYESWYQSSFKNRWPATQTVMIIAPIRILRTCSWVINTFLVSWCQSL